MPTVLFKKQIKRMEPHELPSGRFLNVNKALNQSLWIKKIELFGAQHTIVHSTIVVELLRNHVFDFTPDLFKVKFDLFYLAACAGTYLSTDQNDVHTCVKAVTALMFKESNILESLQNDNLISRVNDERMLN